MTILKKEFGDENEKDCILKLIDILTVNGYTINYET